MSSFDYVKGALGMVMGLSIATVLNGLVRFVQHPERYKPDWTHLGWAAYMLISLVGFWWWEQGLASLDWTFWRFLFVMSYAALQFSMSALLFPMDVGGYSGYLDYLLNRRRWFFGMMLLIVFVDVGDTLLKGWDHYRSLGFGYPIKSAAFALLSVCAIATRAVWFHRAWVVVALLWQVVWIGSILDRV